MPCHQTHRGILFRSINCASRTTRGTSAIVTLVAFVGLSLSIQAQETPWQGAAKPMVDPTVQRNIDDWFYQGKGVPEDWTHHRLVFTDPGTEAEAIKIGKYEHWLQTVNDPRFILQQIKRGRSAEALEGANVSAVSTARADGAAASSIGRGPGMQSRNALNKDWSMVLGGSATVGAGMYPAKFSFNPIGTANCGSATSPDFVAFNTSTAGSSTQATIVAYDNLYSGCTGQVPSVYWAFNTGGTAKTSAVLSPTGSQLAFIQTPSTGNAELVLLTWKAKPTGRNLTSGTTNIKSGSTTFTTTSGLTSMDVGAGISGTGIPTGDTIATVTSATAGTLTTAATGAGTSGEALSITADAGYPDTLTATPASSYYNCAAPCFTTISFSGTSRADSISSPYYDYGSDTLYVGDASGGLHKFHPVFDATPAEVETSGGPWAAASTAALSSPVYNGTDVFVGDVSGYLYSVNSSGSVVKSVELAVSPGIVDSPLIDSSAGQIYVFVSADMNGSNTGNSACQAEGKGALACDGIINLPATFTATTEFTESVTGVGTTNVLYDGAFDNLYWVNGTGNIYVNSSTGTNEPKLMEVPVSTTGLSTEACQTGTNPPPNASAVQCAINIDNPLTSAAAAGGPVTEICNNGASACTASSTDYIFTSVTGSSRVALTGCAIDSACVYSWTTTTALTGSTTNPGAGLLAPGGSSGIIIDNTATTGGASNIYYSTLGTTGTCTTSGTVTTGGCAVQISQSGL